MFYKHRVYKSKFIPIRYICNREFLEYDPLYFLVTLDRLKNNCLFPHLMAFFSPISCKTLGTECLRAGVKLETQRNH